MIHTSHNKDEYKSSIAKESNILVNIDWQINDSNEAKFQLMLRNRLHGVD